MVALNIILAQIGCFVPCSWMKFTPFNFIFCKAGDQDQINQKVPEINPTQFENSQSKDKNKIDKEI